MERREKGEQNTDHGHATRLSHVISRELKGFSIKREDFVDDEKIKAFLEGVKSALFI